MADKHRESWAVCPFIPLGERRLIDGPVIFDSRVKADAFLKDATIFVYDGWGRGEEKNFASREEWLQEIAGWLRSPSDSVPDDWENLSRAEIMAAHQKREQLRTAKLNRFPVSKRAVCVPPRPGSDVYFSPWPKQVRVALGDLIGLAIPVHHLSADSGPPCSRRLAEVQPEELNPTAVSKWDQFFDMCMIEPGQPWMYCLDRSWGFLRIAQEASECKWHKAPKYNLKIENPRQHFWKIILELEASLHKHHLNLSATSLRAFWTSWQISGHLHGLRREIEKYAELPGAVAGQIADIAEAVTMVESNLRSYVDVVGREKACQHAGAQRSVPGNSGYPSIKPDSARPERLETAPSIPGGTQPAVEPGAKPKAKPGPTRDRDLARNVLAVIERVAPKSKWKSKLEEICEAMDDANIPRPKTWPRRQPPLWSWVGAFSVQPNLAKKAISYHLKNAQN